MHEHILVVVKAKDADEAEDKAYAWLEKHEKEVFSGTGMDYWGVEDAQRFCEEYVEQLVEEDLDGGSIFVPDCDVETDDIEEALRLTKGAEYWAVLVDYHM